MPTSISLRDANQGFAKLVRRAEAGESFVITRRGRPVATLAPASARTLTPAQAEARERARERMRRGWDIGHVAPLDRDALHGR